MKELLPQVSETIVTLLFAVITLLIARATAALQAKASSEQSKNFVQRASDQARDVVLELEQTMVQAMRKATSDGKLDREDVEFLKDESLRRLKEHLGPKGVSEGLKVLGFKDIADLERVLRAKIEAEIAATKPLATPIVNVEGVRAINVAAGSPVSFEDSKTPAS